VCNLNDAVVSPWRFGGTAVSVAVAEFLASEADSKDGAGIRLQTTNRIPLLPNFLNSLRVSNGYGEADSWFESCSLRHYLRD
jgi:hypothetical protein